MNNYVPICDDWYVSKLNSMKPEFDAVAKNKIVIADCTLRDGEQQPGIVFTMEDKIAIAKQLDKLGVNEIELSIPAMSNEEKKTNEKIIALGLNAKISIFSRALKSDIDEIADMGAWGIRISLPVGDLQRKYKLPWSEEKYFGTIIEMIEYAKKKGLNVNYSPYDTTRADLDFLDRVLKILKESGCVDIVRAVDTVGAANPYAMKYLVKRMKDTLENIPIEIHCHNDFGLAVANTIAGIEGGATVISSTMNGLGERCGNTPTEEIVMALKILYGMDLNINHSLFKETSTLIEELSGFNLQPNKPVVGNNCFAHESGIAVAGMAKMHFTSEGYAPHLVGQKSQVIIGKKSGSTSIEIKLKELGFNSFNEKDVKSILIDVKEISSIIKSNIDDELFVRIVNKRLSNF